MSEARVIRTFEELLEGIRFENGYYTGFPKLVEETAVEPEEADRLVERILTTLDPAAVLDPDQHVMVIPDGSDGDIGPGGRKAQGIVEKIGGGRGAGGVR